MEYIKLETELFSIMDPCIDDEALGRVIRAIMHYAKTGEWDKKDAEYASEDEIGFIYMNLLRLQIDKEGLV